MRSRLGIILLLLGTLTLLATLPLSASAQDDDGWGTEQPSTSETAPLPAPPDVTVEPAPAAPETSSGTAGTPTGKLVPSPPSVDSRTLTNESRGWQFLSNYHQSVRWVLVALLVVVAYIFPTLFFPGLLRHWGMSPGGGAALCLVVGGLVTTPAVAALMARQVFLNALPVPWWSQQETLIPAAIYMAVFLVLGIVAWVTGRPGNRT